ncbi:methyltransferase domain-containing protein [Streptomyces sp. DH24]|uniref:methyltransferase domain-containing protein n=1 Tax=Streptomyces sp. DH24 TaxID=3040123 RepID=UPI0024419F72|nr:methyltransferase domain-containing protein [Streptomyces sp. DH24]MDG9719960.1 methyltransferase domain-containing protein [Streptomyces sp. DH24]
MADASGFHLTGSAPERYEQYAAPIMAPFVTALLDAVDLCPGETVLDLACGTGFVARIAAAHVGPTGHVCGTDLNEGMLKVAAAHHPRQYPDIEFAAAPADRLPYADAVFDAVLCQQGAQFFPDLDAALREAARVTRPGGRFAATVWSGRERSPYLSAQYEALAERGGQDLADSVDAAFSCTPERITAALEAAGFQDVATREVTFGVALPPLAGFAAGQLASVPWGQQLADEHGDETLAAAGRAIADRLAEYTAPDGSATVPFTATLTTAKR